MYKTNMICNNCNTIFYKEFEKDVKSYKCKCPICGSETNIWVPNSMKVLVRMLVLKGYKIKSIFYDQLGLEINPIADNMKTLLSSLPSDYVYADINSDNSFIFYNEKLYNKEEVPDNYRVLKTTELLNWIRGFEKIKDGHEFSKEDLDDFNSDNGGVVNIDQTRSL